MTEWIVTSSLLILVIALMRHFLKGRISLRLQYCMWLLVLIRLLIPVSFGSSRISVLNLGDTVKEQLIVKTMSEIGEFNIPRQSFQSAYEQVVTEYEADGINVSDLEGSAKEALDYEAYSLMKGPSLKEILFSAAYCVWIAGIAIFLSVLLITNLHFANKLKRTKIPIEREETFIPVYLSDAVETPCLFGLFHPAIYIPPETIENEKRLHHVLEHEMTHYIHGDHIWSVLRGICLAVHWYNPLVWMAADLSRRDAELACDEKTIKRIGENDREEYGRTLIELTRRKTGAGTLMITATTMTGSHKSIKERIMLIAKKPKTAVYTLIAVILIAAIAVGCTFTGAKKEGGELSPWEWAHEIKNTFTAECGGTEVEVDGIERLTAILNGLVEDDFSENTSFIGGMEILVIDYEDTQYAIMTTESENIVVLKYAGEFWNIESEELCEFIAGYADSAENISMESGEYSWYIYTNLYNDSDGFSISLPKEMFEEEGTSTISEKVYRIYGNGSEYSWMWMSATDDGVAVWIERSYYPISLEDAESAVASEGYMKNNLDYFQKTNEGQLILVKVVEDGYSGYIWYIWCTMPDTAENTENLTPVFVEIIESFRVYNEAEQRNAVTMYGFTVETSTTALGEVGQQWANEYAKQYVNNTSEDNSLHSSDSAVLNCEVCAVSLISNPRRVVYIMGFAWNPTDKKAFENFYAGWAEEVDPDKYPQYEGWLSLGWYVELEQSGNGSWSCIDAGTGGYGGWGYLNYDWDGVFEFYMDELLSGNCDTPELIICNLPLVDWSKFDQKYSADGWNALWTLLNDSCLTEGQVYGPEETRMWSDVYPDDQAYRNLYVMLAAQETDGAYSEGIADILVKQRDYDTEIFNYCLQQLTADQRSVVNMFLESAS